MAGSPRNCQPSRESKAAFIEAASGMGKALSGQRLKMRCSVDIPICAISASSSTRSALARLVLNYAMALASTPMYTKIYASTGIGNK